MSEQQFKNRVYVQNNHQKTAGLAMAAKVYVRGLHRRPAGGDHGRPDAHTPIDGLFRPSRSAAASKIVSPRNA